MQTEAKRHEQSPHRTLDLKLHPNWWELIRQCERLGYGEILRLKIQDGLPMAAEVVKRRIVFSKHKHSETS